LSSPSPWGNHHTHFIKKIALGKTASDIGMPFWSLLKMGVTLCQLKSADKRCAPFYRVVKWAQWGMNKLMDVCRETEERRPNNKD